MAKKNSRGYLQDETVRYKRYRYVLRLLLAVRWIDAGKGMPPMRFAELVAGTVDDHALLSEIDELLAVKMRAGEAEYGPRRPAIHAFIEAMLAEAGHDPQYKQPQGDPADLDRFPASSGVWGVATEVHGALEEDCCDRRLLGPKPS